MSKLNPNAKPFVPGASKPAPKPGPGANPAAKAKLQGAAKQVGKMAMGTKAMTAGANAIKTGDASGGHLSERHVGISHGQMIDRIHGKDPGGAFKNKQRKEVVSKFASPGDANKAMNVAMNNPAVQNAAKSLQPGKVSGVIKVPLGGAKVQQEIMKGPGFAGTGKNKIPKQGPAQLIKKDVKSVNVAVRKTPDGKTGFHTGYSNPH
jgi:Ataxin-2 C-terminal region